MVKESHLKIVLESASEVTSVLGRLMSNRPTATTLEFTMAVKIRDSHVPLATISTIFDMIGTLPHLERLKICGKNIPLDALASTFHQASALQELDLVDLRLSLRANAFPILIKSVQLLVNLRRARFSGISDVHPCDWHQLLYNMAGLPLLEELVVEQVEYVGDSAHVVQQRSDLMASICNCYERFSTCNTLQKLTVKDPILNREVLLRMVQGWIDNNTTTCIQEINLASSDRMSWDLDCVYALAELLLVNSTLQILRIAVHDDFLPPALQSLRSCNRTLRVFSTKYDLLPDGTVAGEKEEEEEEEVEAGDDGGQFADPEEMSEWDNNSSDNDSDSTRVVAMEDPDNPDTNTNNNNMGAPQPTELQKTFSAMLRENTTLMDLQCDEDFTPEMSFYLHLNQAGRKRLLEDTDQAATRDDWIRAIMTFSHETSVVYFFLSHNPSLIANLGYPSDDNDSDRQRRQHNSTLSDPNTPCCASENDSLSLNARLEQNNPSGKRKMAPARDDKQTVEEVQEEYEARILQLQELHIAELSEKDQQLALRDAQMKQLVTKWNRSLRSMEGRAKRIKVPRDEQPNMQELQSMLQSLMRKTCKLEHALDSNSNNNPKKRVPAAACGNLRSTSTTIPTSRKKGRTSHSSDDTHSV